MDVSVIIVNYKSAALVADCIRSVNDKTLGIEYEIIIVDNDSQDGSVEMLAHEFGNSITILEAKDNLGFGKANNLGAQLAKGEFLFLLNPDTVLVNNAMKILIEYIKNHEDVGVAGANLYGPEMTAAPSYCEAFDDIRSEKKQAAWTTILSRKSREKIQQALHLSPKPFEHTFNYSNDPKEVAYIFGADMMMRRELFEKVGGFDPDFFMYAEEEELSWRIHKLNKKSVSVPKAKIIHLEGMTLKTKDSFSEKQFRMRMNGTMTYYYKRFGRKGLEKFYKIRMSRYNRLIKIAKVKKKKLSDFGPVIMSRCLKDEYMKFMNNKGV